MTRDGRRPKRTTQANQAESFWRGGGAIEPPAPIRPAADPTTLVRSLGAPPLHGHETVATHYFAAVYEKAVAAAVALAAANSLLVSDADDDTD